MTIALSAIGVWLSFSGTAIAGESCDDWGSITPAEVTVLPTETVTFRIMGATSDCGDADTCEWWLDDQGGLGSFDSELGSPVIWTAPEDASMIDGCIPLSFSVYARCLDQDTLDSAVITLICSEEDKLRERAGDPDTSVTGGGCQSSRLAEALVVVPLLGLGWCRRKD